MQYDVDDFFEKYKLYSLWRYDLVDSVPMPDEKEDEILKQGVPELPVIAVDHGNKTNYRTYEDVVISVFDDGENEIEISRGDELIEKLTISGRGSISRRFDRGYYKACHLGTGKSVEFCVTEPNITYSVKNGMLTVEADSCDPESKILYMDFREISRGELAAKAEKDGKDSAAVFYSTKCAALSKVEELTDEEKKTGRFTRPIPDDAANFKVYFENKYGVWTHTMIRML